MDKYQRPSLVNLDDLKCLKISVVNIDKDMLMSVWPKIDSYHHIGMCLLVAIITILHSMSISLIIFVNTFFFFFKLFLL